MATNLLQYPSLVQSPFIIVKIGDYEFGSYKATETKTGNYTTYQNRKFPNYVNSLTVTKVNGSVNTYNLSMIYQVREGDDPNYLDKVLSKVGYGGTVKFSYGDWSCPSFVYKDEEAIITNVKTRVEFSTSRITYDITCMSNSLKLISSSIDWEAVRAKPSDIIKEIINSETYGIKDIFPGMYDNNMKVIGSYIASDDKVVDIPAKTKLSLLNYLNFLVSCMSASSNTDDNPIQDSAYYMTIYDDAYSENGGAYFKVTKVDTKVKTLSMPDTYEVDVNFPLAGVDSNGRVVQENLISSFNTNDDLSWSLLYKYSADLKLDSYIYKIDNKGNTYYDYSPNVTTSTRYKSTTEAQKDWWTKMTQFPITASMTVKGLLRPAMLMSYVKINTYFYGSKHVTSGLYIITKQTDSISGSGYRTDLELTRINGDDEDQLKTHVTQIVENQKNLNLAKKSSNLYNQYLKNASITTSTYKGVR